MKSFCTLITYTFCLFTPSLQYYFGVNWGVCQHICTNEAKNSKIEGYYWKDFDGVIPSDAWVAGQSKDNTDVYVGVTYDPDNHGSFLVTIYAGQPFVLNTVTVKSKLTKYMRILCTQEPEKMKFVYATPTNFSAIISNIITAGKTQIQYNGKPFVYHLAVAKDLNTNLIGGIMTLHGGMNFTLPSGEQKNSLNFVVLTFGFEPEGEADSSVNAQQKKPFFSHKIHVGSNKKGSIVPDFYTEFKYGSCCSTCSNMISPPDTMYYWRDKKSDTTYTSLPDAFVAGHTSNGYKLYLIETYYYPLNLFFTAANYSTDSAFFIKDGSKQNYALSGDLKVLSSSNKDTLVWIPVNATTASSYKNAALIGTADPTGKIGYIGRYTTKKNEVIPGLVYLDGKPRLIPQCITAFNTPVYDFEMLTYKGKKPNLPRSVLDYLLSFLDFNIVLKQDT